jgi:hypothetical protein
MAANDVQYVLTLKDNFNSVIREADANTNKLESSILHVGEAIGIAFGLHEIVSFGREILDNTSKFQGFENRIRFASESTADAASNMSFLSKEVTDLGLPMEAMYEGFSDLQAGMMGTKIQGETLRNLFDGVSIAAASIHIPEQNLSRALYDLKEIGEVGISGRMVRSLKQQFTGIKDVVKQTFGKTMEELNASGMSGETFLEKLGPGLKKYFQSGLDSWKNSLQFKMQETHNDFLRLQLQMGADLEPFYMSLMNGIIAVTAKAKELWAFFVLHKEVIKEVSNLVLVGAEIWGTYALVMGGIGGIISLIKSARIAMIALNLAMDANPIVAVISILLLLSAAMVNGYNNIAEFRAAIWSTWAVIKEFGSIVESVFTALAVALQGVFTLNPSEIAIGLNAATDAVKDSGLRLATAAKFGWAQGMADFGAENKSTSKGLVPNGVKPKSTGGGELAPKEVKTKGTGSKSVTINVSIKDLIGTYNSNVTNIKEMSSDIRGQVVAALTSAVNDFQIVAGE